MVELPRERETPRWLITEVHFEISKYDTTENVKRAMAIMGEFAKKEINVSANLRDGPVKPPTMTIISRDSRETFSGFDGLKTGLALVE